ncbi:hypothetical protein Barb7_00866 [Bacteroidales bacterium Barb7]|nr:hypothetical protein Barb7_00866 [Bacteroidales bacterium Barb7]
MNKVSCIGIIAEDNSDFETAKILIKRIINKDNLTFKKAIGDGCGKLHRKAAGYAIDLKKRGCDMLILIHDLDRNDHDTLLKELTEKIENTPIEKRFICIPVEEIEAWLISDPESIKKSMKLARTPKFTGQPETIQSPKEVLAEQVYLCSNKSTLFLNTKHNPKLAESVSIDLVRQKCESFERLYDFVTKYQY